MAIAEALPLEELVARQTPGMSLEQPFYTDAEIFERDLERIVSKQWLFVDHVSAIPKPGDLITYEIAGESIILVRGKDDEVRAFFNVCRHRGSRICLKSEGQGEDAHLSHITPGSGISKVKLIRAKLMPEGFRSRRMAAASSCQVRVWQGMIFRQPGRGRRSRRDGFRPEFETGLLIAFIANHTVSTRRRSSRRRATRPTATGNWPSRTFRECYHCAPSHPEYTMVNAYVNDGEPRPRGARRSWLKHGPTNGKPRAMPPGACGFSSWGDGPEGRAALWRVPPADPRRLQDVVGGRPTGGAADGRSEGLGLRRDAADLRAVDSMSIWPTITRRCSASRRSRPTHTDVIVSWLVRGDAVEEDRDYDTRSRLTWMWDVTTVEDTKIIGPTTSWA